LKNQSNYEGTEGGFAPEIGQEDDQFKNKAGHDDQQEQSSVPANVSVIKVPNNIDDPLQKNVTFSFAGWAYNVYDVRSRGRKFIQRVGKININPMIEKSGVQNGD